MEILVVMRGKLENFTRGRHFTLDLYLQLPDYYRVIHLYNKNFHFV